MAGSTRTKSATRTPVLLMVVAAVFGLLTLAWLSADRTPVADETAPVTVEGDPLPRLETSAPDQAIGSPAPTAFGTAFDGSQIAVGEGPSLVLFVTHWCSHCQDEVAALAPVLTGDIDGVPVVTVSTWVTNSRPNYPPSAWLDAQNWTVPTVRDDAASTLAQAYGLGSTPMWVALDADGTVVARVSGTLTWEQVQALAGRAVS